MKTKKKSEHEEWMAQIIQKTQEAQKLKKQKEDQSIIMIYKELIERENENYNIMKEFYKELRTLREKSSQTPVKRETTQPSALTPAPPTEPQKNNTTDLKQTPVKETPTQPSAENKPSPANKPSTIPQDSLPQGSDTTNQWHINPIEIALVKMAPYLFYTVWTSIFAPRTGIYLRSPTQKHSQNRAVQKEDQVQNVILEAAKKTPDTKTDYQKKDQNRDSKEGTATTDTKE